MTKNCLKSLIALLCTVGISISSCKKQDDFSPDSISTITSSKKLNQKLFQTTSLSGLSSTGLFLGINGHPFGDAAYLSTPATKQVAMLKSMNMNWYRINVRTTSDGTISAYSSSLFASLQEAAASGKVNLLPMLYTRTLSLNDNVADAYKKGKVLGGNFAAKYGKYFTYYNLGNDLELDLLNKHTTGREVSNYDEAKSSITAAYLKGMDEGIKLNDPGAKTIIDAGWLHWGFLTICKNNNVNFDAVGYHWYSDMEGPAARAPYNISDITVTLANNFPDKEIWFTEFGYRYKALSLKNEADQNEFMTKFVEKCKNNPRVKVAIAYELFDEPYKGSHEGNYGFMKWTSLFTVSLKKLVAESFSKSILAPPTDTATNTPNTPIDTELVTNITGNSGNKFHASKLKVDSTYYTDRVYKIKSLPTYLANTTLIKTSNDDKFNKQDTYISFKLARPATVYIAYDSRASKIPAWLKEYTKVTDKLGIDDPKVSTLNLYKKDFEKGTVALDGNLSGSANGAFCHYVLIIKENK